MFTAITWQDWQSEGYDAVEAENTHAQAQKAEYIWRIIKLYKASDDFRNALTANEYFRGNNPEVQKKAILRKRLVDVEVQSEDGKTKKVQQTMANELIGNRIPNKIFGRFVIQQNQFLLSNGVTMQDATMKERLGKGFDKVLQRIGQNALKHGVGWGFWNHDHIESISAADDALTGFVALIDEMTQEPMVGIQFWQISSKKPMTVRLFEGDGITMYRTREGKLEISEPKRAYVVTSMVDALGVAAQTGTNYDRLPVIPFFANEEKASELTYAIKQKIDLYDRIVSDFGDNLDRTNDVYWVLNNYGGSTREIQSMLRMIEELRVVVNQTDGGTSSTAEPKTFEVPYVARQTALDLLRKALYQNMAGDTLKKIEDLKNTISIEEPAILASKPSYFEYKRYAEWSNRDDVKAYKQHKLELNALQKSLPKGYEVYKKILSHHREIGGYSEKEILKNLLANSRLTDSAKQFAEMAGYMPKDWLDAVAKKGIVSVRQITGRAYYDDWERKLCTDMSRGTTIHEMQHMFENDVSSILEAEKAFYDKRTAGCQLEWLGRGYNKYEKSRFDSFFHKYMGKDYGGTSYELMSMAVEDIFARTYSSGSGRIPNDDEMTRWALGVLALVR